jgi:hypothetical protein
MLSWTKHLVLCIFQSLLLDEPPMTIITFAIARRPTRTFDCQQRTILIAACCRGNATLLASLSKTNATAGRTNSCVVAFVVVFVVVLLYIVVVASSSRPGRGLGVKRRKNADDEDYIADDREKR